ncbi:MAG TPA: quinone-dependent dihydroorotate dehydrogenase, partial [Dongiaceae bacterium]|jgi:dihydroorotate dehydrogenase|nr:quinone-dependent dihydroorotate dehydrogenase [Dongiaceae bacterium]
MGWPYKKLVRPLLFAQDAERAHDFTLKILASASRSKFACDAIGNFFSAPELPVELFGLKFPNPIGLAAGMDKFAAAVPVWEKLGFGFCELGGVTWRAQDGNPQPRMFRAIADEAIVNRMGFNNFGAEVFARKLSNWKKSSRWPSHPIGINLGKSKTTPLEKAAEDYANSFRVLRNLADFFVVNVSSPNTPNLRQLQDKSALDEILAAIQEQNRSRNSEAGIQKPVLVKVAPDLSFEALDEILELASSRQIAGIVATNTTISRPQTSDAASKKIYFETGGLSGKPLRERSTEIIRHIFKQTNGKLPIIGVGGIFSADDAWEKIIAGASLIQIYTGLVFEGPGIAKEITGGLVLRMKTEGMKNLQLLIGSDLKK